MTLTFNGLLDADFSVLEAVGAQWLAQADRFDERDGDLDDVRRKRLAPDNWDGTTADRGRATIRVIGEDLAECASICRRIAGAIEEAAEIFTERQGELESLVTSPPQGVVIGGDGSVRPLESEVTQHRQLAISVSSQIRTILEAVTEADQTLHAAIAAVAGTASASERLGLNAGISRAGELREMLADGVSPARINEWWNGLTPFEQQGLLDRYPDLLGPTDGVPSDIRDTANRTLLDRELTHIDRRIEQLEEQRARLAADGSRFRDSGGILGSMPSQEYASLLAELRELEEQRDKLGTLQERISQPYELSDGSTVDYYLLGYDSADDGQAIVAVGNPDTADNVNVYVPGTGAELPNTGDIARAEIMTRDAYEFAPGSESATIMWLGYDAPDNALLHSPSTSYADAAASDLSSFADGLRATSESGANLTMTGHSYGSTTIGVAARDAGLDVDNMIFVGSPGVGVDSASDLGIDPENVWASRNGSDIIDAARPGHAAKLIPIVGSLIPPGDQMVHGRDPVAASFGGNTFTSDATRGNPVANHSAYWDEENEIGRENLAYIVTGQEGKVN